MNKKQRITLGAISSISENFVNEATEERIRYVAAMKKKEGFLRPKRFAALAASLFIIISSVFAALMFVNTKQVPIYEGMTVSSEAPGATSAYTSDGVRYSLASASGLPLFSKLQPEFTEDIEKVISNRFGTTAGKYDYYANKNDDVYITVHIDNPDGFEILSFTLNGVKYTSYMFEEGSDLENLVLKVNVGNAEEVASYTIDAIKYVDGEKIKDVKMHGDKTVEIGIRSVEQPSSTITVDSIESTSLSFDVDVTDTKSILALSQGKLYAMLCDGSSIVAEKELSLGENEGVLFENLTPKSVYKCAVVAVYDSYDGEGIVAHVLDNETVSLDPTIYFESIRINGGELVFSLSRYNDISALLEIRLHDAHANTIGRITPSSREDLVFHSLRGGEYSLILTYTYSVGEETVTESVESPKIFCIAGFNPVAGGIVSRPYSEEPIFNPTLDKDEEHLAVDITPAGENKAVRSITPGTVSLVDSYAYYGKKVVVTDALGYEYHYCSLDRIDVELGDSVNAGDVIGIVGDTMLTELAVEDHLHFFLKDPDGNVVDPKIVLLPVVGSISRPYSEEMTFNPTLNRDEQHLAVDVTPSGDNKSVYSLSAGTVITAADNNPVYGKIIVIEDLLGYQYYYCSLDGIEVSVGDVINVGDIIGAAGDTMLTEMAVDDHVHFFLKDPDGNIIDPKL